MGHFLERFKQRWHDVLVQVLANGKVRVDRLLLLLLTRLALIVLSLVYSTNTGYNSKFI